VKRRYGSPEIWILENGVTEPDEYRKPVPEALSDTFRVNFYHSYLNAICEAVTLDGVNVTTYTAWTFIGERLPCGRRE
jgi:beta-glucosidase